MRKKWIRLGVDDVDPVLLHVDEVRIVRPCGNDASQITLRDGSTLVVNHPFEELQRYMEKVDDVS